MKKIFIIIFSAVLILAVIFCITVVHRTTKIAFLGDSITEYGWINPNGYVQQISRYLENSGLNVEPIPVGISGDTTTGMRQRLDRDVLNKKPDVVFFMGGINDIWFNRCTFDEFKNNINIIIEKILQSGAKPVIISLTLITEDVDAPENKRIDEFNEYLKEITRQKNVLFVDANTIFKNELKKHKNTTNILTTDGVHLNDYGNTVLAQTVVKEFLKTYKH